MRNFAFLLFLTALSWGADQIYFQGRYSSQVWEQASQFGTNVQWQVQRLIRPIS